jgi:hypothetical protein
VLLLRLTVVQVYPPETETALKFPVGGVEELRTLKLPVTPESTSKATLPPAVLSATPYSRLFILTESYEVPCTLPLTFMLIVLWLEFELLVLSLPLKVNVPIVLAAAPGSREPKVLVAPPGLAALSVVSPVIVPEPPKVAPGVP